MMEVEKVRFDSPLIKMAVQRKLITMDQYEQCRELQKKSKKIGLETTIEDILIKQGYLTKEQFEELQEISSLGEGGDVFGGYRLGKLLGQGGMGKVYEAIHEFTGRKVALKILNAATSRDQTIVARFFQEIRALAKLVHPGIVRLYDAGKAGRRYFFAMELVEGQSLAQYVEKKKLVSEKKAIAIIKNVAEALSFSHSAGIIHRDIKPENILIDETGTPKLTDFGVVMHQDADHMTLTQTGYMVGSVYFASPEQVQGDRDIDGRTDLYSLGATFYYLLTGRMVYNGANAQEVLTQHLVGNFISPRKFNPTVSKRTVGIIRKMMAKNRDKRYQSMDELIRVLEGDSLITLVIRISGVAISAATLFTCGILFERIFHITTFFMK
ncbi:MAG: serine/threonine protein kinase [Fibrobacter sp.]|nr:serine/threonine protein kinase [Fibrobacter sp.]